eukprot:tig00000842_g4834.t1
MLRVKELSNLLKASEQEAEAANAKYLTAAEQLKRAKADKLSLDAECARLRQCAGGSSREIVSLKATLAKEQELVLSLRNSLEKAISEQGKSQDVHRRELATLQNRLLEAEDLLQKEAQCHRQELADRDREHRADREREKAEFARREEELRKQAHDAYEESVRIEHMWRDRCNKNREEKRQLEEEKRQMQDSCVQRSTGCLECARVGPLAIGACRNRE